MNDRLSARERVSGLCDVLAARTGTDARDWFPVFKARYGMQVAFDVIEGRHGRGAVMTQLFTCCTAVDPIVCTGFAPRYADVDADTLSIDTDSAKRLADADDDLRAVMLQHTFGLIDDASSRRLTAFARERGALVIEDCAHCVTRMARDGGGTPLADISVHSFGVEKILPTRFGGAIWINPKLAETDPQLDSDLRRHLGRLPRPTKRIGMVTRLYVNENRILSRLPGGSGGALRSLLTNIGLYEPPIAEAERRGGLAYEPMGMTPWMARRATAGIDGLDANETGRRRVTAIYRDGLHGLGDVHIPGRILDGEAQPLLRFPLFAQDTQQAERIIAAVRAVGGYAERWYRPELFPGVTDEHAYGLDALDRSTVQVTGRLVEGAVSLPTEVSLDRAGEIVTAVRGAAA
ncbi:DegT/DnrJ/EryC1/StrS aminotransferase family protein [Bifidobacterium sp. SMB2]|uniref:DegT/DnrJ/EryC1/StrS aminotransferase family protein n=1 Tax=Bifidobacterium saimiriisciurei TaxID=2661627 RepID=A0ABX0C7P7_9BIFI|nr:MULTISPECIES: DegT/DnrJ/EryC1/StrS family aminotransferase [Bifidobacterium]NEG95756.1 DegT/DnrJ/EryC1/StrS aminotransferase family protein [Bifidobacterium sp. SMB2]NEH11183.1 DegT/DnrJ/EryC1/StrS aminotransferase family protein [Bifidobacterium saimiriisciurei]